MVVLNTRKNEEDPIKNEDARVFTTLYIDISDTQGQITPSLPARMKVIHSKMKGLEWSQHCSHYKSMGTFPVAQGQLTPQSMVGLAECRTHPYSYGCPNYLQESRRSDQK